DGGGAIALERAWVLRHGREEGRAAADTEPVLVELFLVDRPAENGRARLLERPALQVTHLMLDVAKPEGVDVMSSLEDNRIVFVQVVKFNFVHLCVRHGHNSLAPCQCLLSREG